MAKRKYRSFPLVKKARTSLRKTKENMPLLIPIAVGAAALIGGAAATKFWILEPATKMFGGKKLGMVIPPLAGTWLLQAYVKPDATPKMKKLVNFSSLALVGAAGVIAFEDFGEIDASRSPDLVQEKLDAIKDETTRGLGINGKLDVVAPAVMPGQTAEPMFQVAYQKPTAAIVFDTISFSIISNRDIKLTGVSWRLMMKKTWMASEHFEARYFAFPAITPRVLYKNLTFEPREAKEYAFTKINNAPSGRYQYRVELTVGDPEFKDPNQIMTTAWYNYGSYSTPGII